MKLDDLLASHARLKRAMERLQQARGKALKRRTSDCRLAESEVAPALRDVARTLGPRRHVSAIAGLPASGKTTLARQTIRRLNEKEESPIAAGVPMDGFHFRNAELYALNRFDRKGAIDTFHADRYADFLIEAKAALGTPMRAPEYDRPSHEVVEASLPIDPGVRMLISEGIYAGLDCGAWHRSKQAMDQIFFLDRDIEVCLQRIIDRNLAVGRDERIIIGKLENDLLNSVHTVEIAAYADCVLY